MASFYDVVLDAIRPNTTNLADLHGAVLNNFRRAYYVVKCPRVYLSLRSVGRVLN